MLVAGLHQKRFAVTGGECGEGEICMSSVYPGRRRRRSHELGGGGELEKQCMQCAAGTTCAVLRKETTA